MRNSIPLYLLTVLVVGSASTYGLWKFQSSLIGKPPTANFTPAEHGQSEVEYNDPDIEKLRDSTKIRPKDRGVWISLARELLSKANQGIIDRQRASLEAVDALRTALDLDPKDAEALILMGDVSFEMQAFTKALDFYKQYLDVRPDDDSTRARYASTMTFLGRADEARQILEGVVDRNPSSFQAHAFLALAFAQLGDVEQVKAQGEKALALAPNEEARLRLGTFLQSFEAKLASGELSTGASASGGDASSGETTSEKPSAAGSSGSIQLGEYLAGNPIAGPKIRDFKTEGKTFIVFVQQFPMSAMPPFAKQKFFGGIQNFVKEKGIKDFSQIEFRDVISGKVEGELKLSE